MTRVFKTAEEYEAFRAEYRKEVVPQLRENAEMRDASWRETMWKRLD